MILHCERCGKEITDEHGYTFALSIRIFRYMRSYPEDRFRVCKECCQQIKNFIKEKEETKNDEE